MSVLELIDMKRFFEDDYQTITNNGEKILKTNVNRVRRLNHLYTQSTVKGCIIMLQHKK